MSVEAPVSLVDYLAHLGALIPVQLSPKEEIVARGKLSIVSTKNLQISLPFLWGPRDQKDSFKVEMAISSFHEYSLLYLGIESSESQLWFAVDPFFVLHVKKASECLRNKDNFPTPLLQKRDRSNSLSEEPARKKCATEVEDDISSSAENDTEENVANLAFFVTFRDNMALYFTSLSKIEPTSSIFYKISSTLQQGRVKHFEADISQELRLRITNEMNHKAKEKAVNAQNTKETIELLRSLYSRKKNCLSLTSSIVRTEHGNGTAIRKLLQQIPIISPTERNSLRESLNASLIDCRERKDTVKSELFNTRGKPEELPALLLTLDKIDKLEAQLYESQLQLELL